MKAERKKRGRSFTKSNMMLDLIADLENVDDTEGEEEEEEVYTELEEQEDGRCKDELQEGYSELRKPEVRPCSLLLLY